MFVALTVSVSMKHVEIYNGKCLLFSSPFDETRVRCVIAMPDAVNDNCDDISGDQCFLYLLWNLYAVVPRCDSI